MLLRAYERSGLTINFIRALIEGGFADLHHPEYWELAFVANSPHAGEYMRMVQSIGDSLRFMETLTGCVLADINRVDFFSSHEGLHLLYEQAQTRQVPRRSGWCNLSTHFPWIGDRTRALDGAHVEYFRGIANPIGVKIGPSAAPEEVLALAKVLNPQNEPGRLTFILVSAPARSNDSCPPSSKRCGAMARRALVLRSDAWQHRDHPGRHQDPPLRQYPAPSSRPSSGMLKECGTHLGGVHFELTGDNVTECIGGASGVTEADLPGITAPSSTPGSITSRRWKWRCCWPA